MEKINFTIESIKQEKGDTILSAIASNEDFLPLKWLKYVAKDSINQRFIWRHSDPEKPRDKMTDEVFGRVIQCEVKDVKRKNSLLVDYRLFNLTPNHKNLIKLIKLRNEVEDPFGISLGYQVYKDKETDEILHIVVLEHSITPIPKCVKCTTIDIKESVVQMEKELEKELRDKIAELEDTLNGKASKVEELEAKVVTFEEEIKEKSNSIKTSEEQFEESKKLILSLKDEVSDLKRDLILKEKKPVITEIFELEQDEDLLKFYESMSIEELEKRREKIKAKHDGKPIVKTLKQSRDETIANEELEKKEKESLEESVKILAKTNPEMKKLYLEMKEKGGL